MNSRPLFVMRLVYLRYRAFSLSSSFEFNKIKRIFGQKCLIKRNNLRFSAFCTKNILRFSAF